VVPQHNSSVIIDAFGPYRIDFEFLLYKKNKSTCALMYSEYAEWLRDMAGTRISLNTGG
jgi:hypothetical protein